jgi:hypothetical protein
MATQPSGITETVRTGRDGLHVDVTPSQLAQAGVEPGEAVVVEVRRATREEWIAANAGRIYESTGDMDKAIDELRALPE